MSSTNLQNPIAPLGDGPSVGKPMDRVDGRLKVTGAARYSAEMPVANALYAVLVTSAIAKGRIEAMDIDAAQKAAGVHLVMTPFNTPKLPSPPSQGANAARPQERKLQLLQDDKVLYNRQPIGVVIAETEDQAIHAASLVRVRYADTGKPEIDLHKGERYKPERVQGEEADTKRGDMAQGRRDARHLVEQTYSSPIENHNPMEPHATVAVWEGSDKLTVYDATQGVFGVRRTLAKIFNLPQQNVRCVCYFVGGGFGCKGSPWSHVPLAAMAARQAGRPVKLVLRRDQMFGPVGHRPQTEQKMLLGADAGGKLTAARHDLLANTSSFDEFIEASATVSRMMYACPNLETSHRLARLDTPTPTFMRAPGESTGTWALEAAMDEMAYAVGMDPVALRLQNYAETDAGQNKPFSSKSLRECYRVGAERFGWEKRVAAPRSMRARDGRLLGMGMATATYPVRRSAAQAHAQLLPDGAALVQAGSQDLGTGTYTIMTQIAADALGLPPSRVRFELGDTQMPETPVSGGSQTTASTGSAVKQTCLELRQTVIRSAIADTASPLHGLGEADVDVQNGRLFAKSDTTRGEEYADLVKRSGKPALEAQTQSRPGEERNQYSMHSFGAVFVEVLVDPDFGEVRVNRVTGAYSIGKVMNAKTCRSQLIGGIVFGVGMALMEETKQDGRWARVMNADLAEYHVPVNADIPPLDIHIVEEDDPHVNPLGVKGVGEIGITGVVAAIGNAVYHATGSRVRDLPITLDKVLFRG